MMKKCCVLIPYYNAGESLLHSIESIDHEFVRPDVIVVDDGSLKTKAAEVIKHYNGPLTIKLVELEQNQGIEHALNKGLDTYGRDYEFIARLDCGDLCKSDRIRKQIQFLEKENSYYFVGSWVDFIGISGKHLFTLQQPCDFDEIKKKMFLNATFTHPSVTFRSAVLDSIGTYPTDAPAAEDYAYFFKIIKKHKASNIQESLVSCLIDPNGISTIKRRSQIRSRISIIIKNFDYTPHAFYGLVRSAILLHTPRSLSILLNKYLKQGMRKTSEF
ncbi:glycosyltransferase [Pseudomonas cavernae]|uniref:Glycosyltransferase n=1 Tax=Pseudomonas cavernae TaxID=2320867 RepID=A0A385Z1G5_9PSED|nr:glycosyltransferase [Pseudomonas cavernae]AYC31462.1 glycosyltransferase [Pseudomonas cavernae]